MKNLIVWCILSLIIVSSCKDQDKPLSIHRGNINDLLGRWTSTDSALMDKGAGFRYYKDTLTFSNDTFISSINGLISPYMTSVSKGIYSFDYFMPDSLILSYMGDIKVGIINNNFRHKVSFNEDKDTMSLIDLRKTFPYSQFYKFHKVK